MSQECYWCGSLVHVSDLCTKRPVSRLTRADLLVIRTLTYENEHQMAMWYAAKRLGLKIEPALATHACECYVEGHLTVRLELVSKSLREQLHKQMDQDTLEAFRKVT